MADRIYQDDDTVTTPVAAGELGKHPVTLAIWRKRGVGPAYSRSTETRCVLYRVGDLRAWVAKDRIVPNKEMQVYARTCEAARISVEVGGNAGVEQAVAEHKRTAAQSKRRDAK